MVNRRNWMMGAMAPLMARGAERGRTVLYAAAGPVLTTYAVDVEKAELTRVGEVTLPDNVQEAWPHPSRRFLYVGWSNNTRGARGHHGLTALAMDGASGVLRPHGEAVPVAARMVFLTLDGAGRYVVSAYNDPSSASVHRIGSDGRLGGEVKQAQGLDFGIYAHQVRVAPSNRMVVVVTRGNAPEGGRKEDPGALKVFGFRDGALSNRTSIAPGGGYGFQPRHLEFHPRLPVAYITLERQNQLQAYRVEGESLSAAPLATVGTLRDGSKGEQQATSTLHAHPNGRVLYVGNRGPAGGENSIAVYALDAGTGLPRLVQSVDTEGVHPRTFTLNAAGRLLVVANMQAGRGPANLAVFRIGGDGKLQFVRKYEQAAGAGSLFWTGMVTLG